jgi:alpha-D-xyloside xylohydrolase
MPSSDRVALSRSAWGGTQRHGVVTWSGDIHSTFDELALQVTDWTGLTN